MSETEVAVSNEVTVPRAQDPADEEQRKAEKLAASRIFFVRLPKPVELTSSDNLERDKDAIDAKLRKISDELQPIMAERSRVAAQLAETREVSRELKAQIEDRERTLNPYQAEKRAAAQGRASERLTREEQRQAEKEQREKREKEHRAQLNTKQKIRNEFNSLYGQLGVTNDDEIDAKIRKLEFQQQHESLSISEEKAVLKNIKQLQESREAVREFAQWSAHENAERDARKIQQKKKGAEKSRPSKEKETSGKPEGGEEDPHQQEMRQLKEEVDGLWEEYKAQLDVKSKQQELEVGLKRQIDTLFEQRDSLRKEREEIWEKIQAHRSEVRAANKPFSENRSFSSSVRELIKKGQLEEACKLCRAQTDDFMGRYASDSSAREEYNRLWDAAVDYNRPAATASESHHHAAASVIAEALEAARKSVASKAQAQRNKEAEVTKSIDSAKPKAKEEVAAEPAAASFSVAKPDIPGMENGGRYRSKPKKEKKVKQAVVELPKLDESTFVPPASVLKSNGPSAAELKAQEIAHNKVAAADAAQRKERRKTAQEKKKVQKAQRAEVQAKVPKEEVAEQVSRPETPPAEENGLADEDSDGEPPALLPAEEKGSKARGRNVRASAPRVGLTPRSRSTLLRKKAGLSSSLRHYSRTAYATFEEHPLYVGMGGVLAVALGGLGLALVLAPEMLTL